MTPSARRLLPPLISVFLLSAAPAAFGWGKTGHRVAGQLAEAHLTAEARTAVTALLGVETLADVSTYADDMRSDPSEFWQKTASPWHYVTVLPGRIYDDTDPPPQGDAVTALSRFAATLRDMQSPLADKRLALKFAVHLVADLHQPMHAGNGRDRGGNDVEVTFFERPTNLHAVWDSALLDHEQLSYSELAEQLARHTTTAEVLAWLDPEPRTWIAESTALRDRIYPSDPNLRWDYVFRHLPAAKLRLRQSGVRLAAWLNQVFDRQTTGHILTQTAAAN